MSSDVDRLRRDVSLVDLAASYGVKLQENGGEFEACCPIHAEDTPSFTIFPGRDGVQRFHCFGCGARGDVMDFVQQIKGVGLRDAVKILGGEVSKPNVKPKVFAARDVYADMSPLPAAGEIQVGKMVRLFNPKRRDTEWAFGKFVPKMVFPYRNADGSLFGYVLRRDLPDGGKETPMVMWCRLPDGSKGWSRFPFPKPRPLYGLDQVGNAEQITIVEGEKCRDAMRAATGRAVVSWAGGTQGVKHADWSPLYGRKVLIWPDADAPGYETMHDIAARLSKKGCAVRVLDVLKSEAA